MLPGQVQHAPCTVDIRVNRLKRPRPIVDGRCHACAVNDPVEFPSPVCLIDYVRGPDLDERVALQMPQTVGVRGNKIIGSDNVGIQARRRVIECREDIYDEAAQESGGAGDENIAAGQLAEHVGDGRIHHFGIFMNDFSRSTHVQ